MRFSRLAAAATLAASPVFAAPPPQTLSDDVAADLPYVRGLYEHFHKNPELSYMERETSARLVAEMSALGFDVTQNVGRDFVRRKLIETQGSLADGADGYGFVAVMENGPGPTLLIRADMDALPLKERTGLPYASDVVAVDHRGVEAPVMHACAHDSHMAVFVGTARRLAATKDQWSGTLVMVGQPAEEVAYGAAGMIADGLYARFPKPDYAIAMHTSGWDPAGAIHFTPGYALANVDSVDIRIKGLGTHGAAPHTGKDPIVVGAQIVNGLQTLVSRETNPLRSGVVTVGAFNAGYKHNIIPDEAHLQLTVRSYEDEVREKLLTGIERIAVAQAASAGLTGDMAPSVEVSADYTPATYNDPELTTRVVGALRGRLGEDRVREREPTMGGEDFSEFGRTPEDVPAFMFWVGGLDPEVHAAAQNGGALAPPGNHSPFFAPEVEPTLTLGVEGMTIAAFELLDAR
ncbi:MAG: amidohydrolase [Parvularculaceae bacterium]